MKTTKTLLFLAAAFLLRPPVLRGQGLIYVSNTNEPVAGSTSFATQVYTQIETGPYAYGYTLTEFSIMLGDNSDYGLTDIHIDLYGSTPGDIDNPAGQVYQGPLPRSPGLHSFAAETNLFLYPNSYYYIIVSPLVDSGGDQHIVFDYTTSTNSSDAGGWSFYAPGTHFDSAAPGSYPLFQVYATPLPPPVLYPIILTNAAVLSDKSFQFGFTNSPGLSFKTYVTSNATLPFTNWIFAGNPVYLGTNYYQFNTGAGVVTNPIYPPNFYFLVTSP